MTNDEMIDFLEVQRWELTKIERTLKGVEDEKIRALDGLPSCCGYIERARWCITELLLAIEEPFDKSETDPVREYMKGDESCRKVMKSSETSSSEKKD